jgi:hypothetical protein
MIWNFLVMCTIYFKSFEKYVLLIWIIFKVHGKKNLHMKKMWNFLFGKNLCYFLQIYWKYIDLLVMEDIWKGKKYHHHIRVWGYVFYGFKKWWM